MLKTKANIGVKHETQTKKKQAPPKISKRTQRGGFLNRCDFAYACRDTVNQVGKIAPGIIKNASNEINNMAQQRINQIVCQGGKEVERVLPKILRGAIEDVYQTPFSCSEILGNNS